MFFKYSYALKPLTIFAKNSIYSFDRVLNTPQGLIWKCWYTGKMVFKSNSHIIANLMLLNQFYTCCTASQTKWRGRDLKVGNFKGLRSCSDFAKFCNRFSDFIFFCLDVQISHLTSPQISSSSPTILDFDTFLEVVPVLLRLPSAK